ncbi:MAG: immunity 49 family protein, partial [Neisseriaceae bacterium]|nr:immunity 49 family protein [Neisseriaceae bacterium]
SYALQCVIKNDWDEYHKIKELANKKFKKLPVRIGFEFDFYDALEKKNIDKINELIKELLKKTLHRMFNKDDLFFYKVFSFHPTLFTKLCWINGLEIEIDNPLVPMKLMPVEPLAEYDLVYDFLKPDYDWEAARKRGKAIQRKEKILRFFGIKKVGGK